MRACHCADKAIEATTSKVASMEGRLSKSKDGRVEGIDRNAKLQKLQSVSQKLTSVKSELQKFATCGPLQNQVMTYCVLDEY